MQVRIYTGRSSQRINNKNMVSIAETSRISHVIGLIEQSTLAHKIYLIIVDSDINCLETGRPNVGLCTGDLFEILTRQGVKVTKTSIGSRLNELFNPGLIRYAGISLDGKTNMPTQSWVSTTREQRKILDEYELINCKTLSTSYETIRIVNWFFDTLPGRTLLKILPQWIVDSFMMKRREAAKYVAKFMLPEYIKKNFPDAKTFRSFACREYANKAMSEKVIPLSLDVVESMAQERTDRMVVARDRWVARGRKPSLVDPTTEHVPVRSVQQGEKAMES